MWMRAVGVGVAVAVAVGVGERRCGSRVRRRSTADEIFLGRLPIAVGRLPTLSTVVCLLCLVPTRPITMIDPYPNGQ